MEHTYIPFDGKNATTDWIREEIADECFSETIGKGNYWAFTIDGHLYAAEMHDDMVILFSAKDNDGADILEQRLADLDSACDEVGLDIKRKDVAISVAAYTKLGEAERTGNF